MSDIAPVVAPGMVRPFEALMAVEGRWTGDERFIMVDGLQWDGLLPMSLKGTHDDGCKVVARIDEIERVPGLTADERFILGRGIMDMGCPEGCEAARQIEEGFLTGVSVELDDVTEGGIDPADPALEDPADAGWLLVTEKARIRALALTPTPAFAEAHITLGMLNTAQAAAIPSIAGPTPLPHDQVPEVPDDPIPITIVASGHTITIPSCPPPEWFAEPTDVGIEGALTITDEGRVYGLLAPANVAHIGRPDVRSVPMGVDYSRFLRGETVTDGGGRVVTGNLTMGCGHNAGLTSAERVTEHYDNSCSLFATVACGESDQGVWVAGAVLPGVTADQMQRAMACQLSGHWLPGERGGMEMLGALLVPMAGFPMARRRASVTINDGRMVASAVPVQFEDCGCDDTPELLTAAASAERWSRVDALEARLAYAERQLSELRPVVASAIARRVKGV